MTSQAQTTLEMALAKRSWLQSNVEGLVVLRSPLLSSFNGQLSHAFTTRLGGNTPAPLHFFNLGGNVVSEELRADAIANRKRLCATLNADYSKLVVPGQVHSANVESIRQGLPHPNLKTTDGITTGVKKRPVLLHFADCVPIILFDPSKHALAVVHAGWRGTAAGIIKNAVQTMLKEHKSQTHDIVAAIGPAIGPCCYPTSTEAAQQLLKSVTNGDRLVSKTSDCQVVATTQSGQAAQIDRMGQAAQAARPGQIGQQRPDLKAINAMQLIECGVTQLDVCLDCTSCQSETFYSHRQSGGRTGRQGAFAELI
jgi:YfiH family protein